MAFDFDDNDDYADDYGLDKYEDMNSRKRGGGGFGGNSGCCVAIACASAAIGGIVGFANVIGIL
ncbi:MAG: hypothetical protein LBS91_06045 [Clostridiales Family XIII bacterium]|jgi:hypothetical protein|nr:hypothetical protein [Clostridiales Family XIII bacterium]